MSAGQNGGKGGSLELLQDKKKLQSDMKLMRRLLRSPVYLPNEYFKEAASLLWKVAKSETDDARVVVGAVRAMTDIAKFNLECQKRQEEKQTVEQHLHLHQHSEAQVDYSKVPLEDLKRIKAELLALSNAAGSQSGDMPAKPV